MESRTNNSSAITMFRRAVELGREDEFDTTAYCAEPRVSESVIQALSSGTAGRAEDARKLTFELCQDSLEEPVFEAFLQSESAYFARNTCPALEAASALSEFQQAYCNDATADN